MYQVHNNDDDKDNKNACLSLDPKSVKLGNISVTWIIVWSHRSHILDFHVELRSQTALKFKTRIFAETMNFKWALQIIHVKGILNSDL